MEMRSCAGRSRRFQPRSSRVLERAARQRAGIVLPELIENAIAHLGGGSVGKGDGDHLAGLVDLGEQAQKSLREQSGFARAGRCADENGAPWIERFVALCLIGRRSFCGVR